MTLSQYYDHHVRVNFKMSWNQYCASVPEARKNNMKKHLKKAYKQFKKNMETPIHELR